MSFSAIIDKSGANISGEVIIKSVSGICSVTGSIAAYGIYPQHKDFYALHISYDSVCAQNQCEEYLKANFDITESSRITDKPLLRRYFALPLRSKPAESGVSEREFMYNTVFHINSRIDGADIFSCGKNMGVFRAAVPLKNLGDYYNLQDYSGWCFIAQGGYSAELPLFSLPDYSVALNGNINSYTANRQALQSQGYNLTNLNTRSQSELAAYIIDYLHRKKGLNFEEIASVTAPPPKKTIEIMEREQRAVQEYLKTIFAAQVMDGDFTLLAGFSGLQNGLMAVSKSAKTREAIKIGEKGNKVYISDSETVIRAAEPNPKKIWSPVSGQPVIIQLKGGES